MGNYWIEGTKQVARDAKRVLVSRYAGEQALGVFGMDVAKTVIPQAAPVLNVCKCVGEAREVWAGGHALYHVLRVGYLDHQLKQLNEKHDRDKEQHDGEQKDMEERQANELKTCPESEKPAMLQRHLGEAQAVENKYKQSESEYAEKKQELETKKDSETTWASKRVPERYRPKPEESQSHDHDRSR
jgi:hypothetical protein